jgi:hypothetical protein
MGKMNCTDGRKDNGRAKLTRTQVREIRRRGRSWTMTALGAEYGVSRGNISLILQYKTWVEY